MIEFLRRLRVKKEHLKVTLDALKLLIQVVTDMSYREVIAHVVAINLFYRESYNFMPLIHRYRKGVYLKDIMNASSDKSPAECR